MIKYWAQAKDLGRIFIVVNVKAKNKKIGLKTKKTSAQGNEFHIKFVPHDYY